MTKRNPTLSPSAIVPMVHWIRHEKVILDFDLAALYGVETRALKQAVRRNLARFPGDFLFKLTEEEVELLVSQTVIPNKKIIGGAVPCDIAEGKYNKMMEPTVGSTTLS